MCGEQDMHARNGEVGAFPSGAECSRVVPEPISERLIPMLHIELAPPSGAPFSNLAEQAPNTSAITSASRKIRQNLG